MGSYGVVNGGLDSASVCHPRMVGAWLAFHDAKSDWNPECIFFAMGCVQELIDFSKNGLIVACGPFPALFSKCPQIEFICACV